ncbi:MAG: 50S ribosome-binding GTPase [Phycisphaeraceae bacterium]|nr:50S ribosome-binding GTPase [Phycisphaeraceae bacterium]
MAPARGTFTIVTPLDRSGPVAIIQVIPADFEWLHREGRLPRLQVGQVRLADLLGVDRGLFARVSEVTFQFMPHGGLEIVRQLAEALTAMGLSHDTAPEPTSLYPEAADPIEARMLFCLSHAASPRAVDLLLEQPGRWRADAAIADPMLDGERSRLIRPPLVVALGQSNIGKSTLLNALAGRSLAAVADEPGTTRDHVGAMLELDGLTLRYVDVPGFRAKPDDLELQAIDIAMEVARRADLLLLCGDATHPPPDPIGTIPFLRIALRRDLGPPGFLADAETAAASDQGLAGLARAVRRSLVSDRALNDPAPWKFWDDDGAD